MVKRAGALATSLRQKKARSGPNHIRLFSIAAKNVLPDLKETINGIKDARLIIAINRDSMHAQKTRIYEALEHFKNHPSVRALLKDGVVKEYSAHMIPEGGLEMMPRLYTGGMLVAGDAAGFVLANGLYLEGVNFAIASGVAAARAVEAAKAGGDFSAQALGCYQQILEESFVLKDLRKFRRALPFIENPRLHGAYPDLICQLAEQMFTVDGGPHEKVLPLARRLMRGRVSWRELLKDLRQAGRAIIW